MSPGTPDARHLVVRAGLEDIITHSGGRGGVGIEGDEFPATIVGNHRVRGVSADAGLMRLGDGARERSGDQCVEGIAALGENPHTDVFHARLAHHVTNRTVRPQRSTQNLRNEDCRG
jgi:hypothetical protein